VERAFEDVEQARGRRGRHETTIFSRS
jgi:hypothetical protein